MKIRISSCQEAYGVIILPKYPGVSPLVVRRLPRYYRLLTELMKNGVERISSREFADMIGFTASQIRQDLNCFGGFGQQGYGYNVASLRAEIGRILSVDGNLPTILVGVGNLGLALANHVNFEACGFKLLALFDESPTTVGKNINHWTVRHVSELTDFCKEHRPLAAVLCVPPSAVPDLVKKLIDLNVKCYWNFTQYDLSSLYRDQILVEDVQLTDSLMTLSFHANEFLHTESKNT